MTFSDSWLLFYASFKSIGHDNPSLIDTEKLYYLSGKLSDKVQSVCSGTSPIYSILFYKYEDKHLLAFT